MPDAALNLDRRNLASGGADPLGCYLISPCSTELLGLSNCFLVDWTSVMVYLLQDVSGKMQQHVSAGASDCVEADTSCPEMQILMPQSRYISCQRTQMRTVHDWSKEGMHLHGRTPRDHL